MIKKNMLNLKSLKAELDALKKANAAVKEGYVDTKKSMSPFFPLILTTILTNLHKIPGVSKLTTLLKLWYGRTTWWKMLVTIRKVFVILNALIGVYAVISISGFSLDNLIIGFVGMGTTYLDMVGSFFRSLFNWFYDFFNNRTPNVPKNPWNPFSGDPRIYKPSGWHMNPFSSNGPGTKNNIADYMIDVAKNHSFTHKSSVSSWYDWMWWTGVIVVTLGVVYLGYTIYNDPSIITVFRDGRPSTGGNATIDPSSSISKGKGIDTSHLPEVPDIQINDARVSGIVPLMGAKVYGLGRNILSIPGKILNPFNYMATSDEVNVHLNAFMERQSNPVTADFRYYPFTEHNPMV